MSLTLKESGVWHLPNADRGLQTNPESQLLKANRSKWVLRLKYCLSALFEMGVQLKYCLSALFAGIQQSVFCSYHAPEREEEKEEVPTSGLCGAEN